VRICAFKFAHAFSKRLIGPSRASCAAGGLHISRAVLAADARNLASRIARIGEQIQAARPATVSTNSKMNQRTAEQRLATIHLRRSIESLVAPVTGPMVCRVPLMEVPSFFLLRRALLLTIELKVHNRQPSQDPAALGESSMTSGRPLPTFFWQSAAEICAGPLPFPSAGSARYPDNLGSMLVPGHFCNFGVAIFLQGLDSGHFPRGQKPFPTPLPGAALTFADDTSFFQHRLLPAVVAEPALIAVAEQHKPSAMGVLMPDLRLLVALSVGLVVALECCVRCCGTRCTGTIICGLSAGREPDFFAPEEIGRPGLSIYGA